MAALLPRPPSCTGTLVESYGRGLYSRSGGKSRMDSAAWLLGRRTTVGGTWIAAKRAMGHVGTVSRAYRALEKAA